ncbi:PAS domain-containing protein [Dongia sp.]|uniref:PAS domain-containing protein n=1 Tax=Dongia sp. TaxID=1977262 RepID=UPI0035B476D6
MIVELDIPFEQVTSPLVRRFHQIWDAKRDGRAMPSWQDIDPAEMRSILPNIIVTSIEQSPFRVFYRLVGTKAASFRHELTGRYLDQVTEFPEDVRAELAEEYQLVCSERRPTYSRDVLTTKFGHSITFFGAIFPLSSDGTQVDRCIAVEDYEGTRPDDIAKSDAGRGYGAREP